MSRTEGLWQDRNLRDRPTAAEGYPQSKGKSSKSKSKIIEVEISKRRNKKSLIVKPTLQNGTSLIYLLIARYFIDHAVLLIYSP